jgi:hypothetical protein
MGNIRWVTVSFYQQVTTRFSSLIEKLKNSFFIKDTNVETPVYKPFQGWFDDVAKTIYNYINDKVGEILKKLKNKNNPFDFSNYETSTPPDSNVEKIFYYIKIANKKIQGWIGISVSNGIWEASTEDSLTIKEWLQIKSYMIQTSIFNVGSSLADYLLFQIPGIRNRLMQVNNNIEFRQAVEWAPNIVRHNIALFIIFGSLNRYKIDNELAAQGTTWLKHAPNKCKSVTGNFFAYFRYWRCQPDLENVILRVNKNILDASPMLTQFYEEVPKVSYVAGFMDLDLSMNKQSAALNNPYIYLSYLDEYMSPSSETEILIKSRHQILFDHLKKVTEEERIRESLRLEIFLFN